MSMISELVEKLRVEAKSMGKYGTDYMATLLTRSADTIEMLSEKVRADRPQGEWIYGEHDVAMCDGYRCDRCGFFVPWDYEHKSIDFINDYKFCPMCGARMKGADDEAD